MKNLTIQEKSKLYNIKRAETRKRSSRAGFGVCPTPTDRKSVLPSDKLPDLPKHIRCRKKGWNVIYNIPKNTKNAGEAISAELREKMNIYRMFSVKHIALRKTESDHIHVAVYLRETPSTWYWDRLYDYFTSKSFGRPGSVNPLLKERGSIDSKLQQYYDYCMDEKQHEEQTIDETFLWRFTPQTRLSRMTPTQYWQTKIREGLTLIQLEDALVSPELSLNLWGEISKNFKKYEAQIANLKRVQRLKLNREKYLKLEKEARPFQKDLSGILDTQNGRQAHQHSDTGDTGKNWFIRWQRLRRDTLYLQNAESKRIAYAWDPLVHTRIIFDIPKHKMKYLNMSVIESLKNGQIFSSFKDPLSKISDFNPSILVLGNEELTLDQVQEHTKGRWTMSTTSKKDYELKSLKVPEKNELDLKTFSMFNLN